MQVDIAAIALVKAFEEVLSVLYETPVKIIVQQTEKKITKEMIQQMIVQVFDIEWRLIISRKRTKDIVTARQCYCYLCRKFVVGLSFKKIGDSVQKDHSSVMNSVSVISDYLQVKDEYITRKLQPLIKQLNR